MLEVFRARDKTGLSSLHHQLEIRVCLFRGLSKTTLTEMYTLYVVDGTNTALYYFYGSSLPEATVSICANLSRG